MTLLQQQLQRELRRMPAWRLLLLVLKYLSTLWLHVVRRQQQQKQCHVQQHQMLSGWKNLIVCGRPTWQQQVVVKQPRLLLQQQQRQLAPVLPAAVWEAASGVGTCLLC